MLVRDQHWEEQIVFRPCVGLDGVAQLRDQRVDEPARTACPAVRLESTATRVARLAMNRQSVACELVVRRC